MPKSAATGTKNVKTSGAKTEPKSDDKAVKADDEKREPVAAKPESNGTIQVTTDDGAIINIDASQPGWKDKVREHDPKNPVLKYD